MANDERVVEAARWLDNHYKSGGIVNVTAHVFTYEQLTAFMADFALAHSAELQRRLDEARAQRNWLIEKCSETGVLVNVLIGAPLEKAYQLVNTRAEAAEAKAERYRVALVVNL